LLVTLASTIAINVPATTTTRKLYFGATINILTRAVFTFQEPSSESAARLHKGSIEASKVFRSSTATTV
jgi:hypothetical protein